MRPPLRGSRPGPPPPPLGDPSEPTPHSAPRPWASGLSPVAGMKVLQAPGHAFPAESGRPSALSVLPELAPHSALVQASSENASHQTNHFNSKKPASKNILRNAKATFKRKSPKTLENAWRRQASITILFGHDKNSSLPLRLSSRRVFAQNLFLLKITTVTNH